MVQIAENKLIIEIDSPFPVDDLQSLQKEIIGIIQDIDYNNIAGANGCPFTHLLNILESTLLTHHQQRHILEFTKWTQNPKPDKVEFEKWLKKSTEWLKNENE